jgi:predicted RNA-binding protein with PIN domain
MKTFNINQINKAVKLFASKMELTEELIEYANFTGICKLGDECKIAYASMYATVRLKNHNLDSGSIIFTQDMIDLVKDGHLLIYK